MVVMMQPGAPLAQTVIVEWALRSAGCRIEAILAGSYVVFVAFGPPEETLLAARVDRLPGVREVITVTRY